MATVLFTSTSANVTGLPFPSLAAEESSILKRIGVPILGDHTLIFTVVPVEKSIAPAKGILAPA